MLFYKFKRTPYRQVLWEFCKENFVLAVRYAADRRLLMIERSWWILWIAASFAACGISVIQMYRKWDENPVVIVYAPKFASISTVPFPAITMCPLSKARVDRFNLTQTFELLQNNTALDWDREMKLRTLAHACSYSHLWKNFSYREDETVIQSLRNMSFSKDTIAQWCMWRYKVVNCSDLLTETLTEDGICYTFNGLPASKLYRAGVVSPDFLQFESPDARDSNWTQDSGYGSRAGLNVYPYRSTANGLLSGLIVTLTARKIDQEFLCSGPYTGFKIVVHTPDEVAMAGDWFFRLNNEDDIALTFTPNVMYTSRKLRDISPLRRNCFFDNERYLRFFNSYNQANCAAECISNLTLQKCGCVKFSMPRTANMKICDTSKIECYRNILIEAFDEEIRHAMKGAISLCGCYPACNSVEYQVEISRMPFYFQELSRAAGAAFDKFNGYDAAVMSMSFKNRHYLPIWRREMLGVTDVIAEFGGLFALLLGASAMSLGEILYYACIRPLRRERIPQIKRIFLLPWAARGNPFRIRMISPTNW